MNKNYLTTIIVLSIMGVLFAGYLTVTKAFTGTCPVTEGCPFLFGWPVCVYGLIIFGTILTLSLILLNNIKSHKSKNAKESNLKDWITGISAFGILFSAYYIYVEYFQICRGHCTFSLGVPTCVYGFVMYTIIFMLSMKKK